jgi:hypothetical protein
VAALGGFSVATVVVTFAAVVVVLALNALEDPPPHAAAPTVTSSTAAAAVGRLIRHPRSLEGAGRLCPPLGGRKVEEIGEGGHHYFVALLADGDAVAAVSASARGRAMPATWRYEGACSGTHDSLSGTGLASAPPSFSRRARVWSYTRPAGRR